MEFNKQKVHDTLDAIRESMDVHNHGEDFFAIYDGLAYQNGNIEEILGRLHRTFPDLFLKIVATQLEEDLGKGAKPNTADPTTESYWELGTSELDLYKEDLDADEKSNLDSVQAALSLLNEQDCIDGDGSVLGRDLKRVLSRDLGYSNIKTFKGLDLFLDDHCGGLLHNGEVTVHMHSSNGRTRCYSFLNSPFKLY